VDRIGREASAITELLKSRESRLASSLLFRELRRRLHDFRQTVDRLEESLDGLMDRRREQSVARLETLGARLQSCHPGSLLDRAKARLGAAGDLLALRLMGRIERELGRINRLEAALAGFSPAGTLARGFSITRNVKGEVITSTSQVQPGETILTQLAGGVLESGVKKIVPTDQL
jgi:exodeoxyribonuclease VII large subunit